MHVQTGLKGAENSNMKRINNDFVSAYQKTAFWHNRQHVKVQKKILFKKLLPTLYRGHTVKTVCQQWKCVAYPRTHSLSLPVSNKEITFSSPLCYMYVETTQSRWPDAAQVIWRCRHATKGDYGRWLDSRLSIASLSMQKSFSLPPLFGLPPYLEKD